MAAKKVYQMAFTYKHIQLPEVTTERTSFASLESAIEKANYLMSEADGTVEYAIACNIKDKRNGEIVWTY